MQATLDQTAQTLPVRQLQEGIERYRAGDWKMAIYHWQEIVQGAPQAGKQSEEVLSALKYLARVYRQMGQIDRAIAQFTQLIAHYRAVGDEQQVGRMLTEQAQLYSNLGQHRQAIALLCGAESSLGEDTIETGMLSKAGRPRCLAQSALGLARRTADPMGEAAALGSLGNAHRLRGDYNDAIADLTASVALAQRIDHPIYEIAALNGLGNTYASIAKRNYRQLQYAQQAADSLEIEKFTRSASQADRQAIAYFDRSLALASQQNDTLNELRTLLNMVLPKHRQSGREGGDAISLIQQARQKLERLPDSREKAYATIRLANLWQLVILPANAVDRDPSTRCLSSATDTELNPALMALLNQAIAIAANIQDDQSTAFALGQLGHLYECQKNFPHALNLTQQAQLTSANQENRYLWEWQAGRILQAQHKITSAIVAYETAVQTLSSIRADIAIASRDFQFDFRDAVEPIYRELTALYLEKSTAQKETVEIPQNRDIPDHKTKETSQYPTPPSTPLLPFISSALKTIDSLRLAEVQNYLGDDCSITVFPKPVALVDRKTAVLSTILLQDRVAVILSLAGKDNELQSQVYWLPASSAIVTATINELRLKLEKRSDLANTYQVPAQQVYDWLIRPFASILQDAKIETLVFIQDGILRSVPMAALHDGKQFLVEQYAIASTLSLNLVDPAQLDRKALRVLAFGLTEPSVIEGPIFFEPLGYVQSELSQIQKIFPGSEGLMNDSFTRDRLKQELARSNFPIVHLATHGKFGIDSRDTFLVTGARSGVALTRPSGTEAVTVGGQNDRDLRTRGSGSIGTQQGNPKISTYNEKLTINQLYRIIRELGRGSSLELLTLTACETAVGSDRDALGIAGISLQAGAKSAVASLWQVDDHATAQLITQFYRNLYQGMSRAQALQFAQKDWLAHHSGSHPGYWAALILVGNWL